MHEALWLELQKAGVEVDPGGKRGVGQVVAKALEGGWSESGVAAWVLEQLREAGPRIQNQAGFVVTLLRDLPASPPRLRVVVGAVQEQAELPEACPACLATNPAAARNPRFRLQLDPATIDPATGAGDPLVDEHGAKVKCPACHPDRVITKAEATA